MTNKEYLEQILNKNKIDLYNDYHYIYKNFLLILNKINLPEYANILVISSLPNQVDIVAIIDHLITNKFHVYNFNEYNHKLNYIDNLFNNFVYYNYNYCYVNPVSNKLALNLKFDLIILPTYFFDLQNKIIETNWLNFINNKNNNAKIIAIAFDNGNKTLDLKNKTINYDYLITEKKIYE